MLGQTSLAATIKLEAPARNSDKKRPASVTKKLRQANAELLRENRIKTDFIAMVSYELRTPLSVIKPGIDLILEGLDGPITEDLRETLQVSQANVDRLTRLTRSVSDFLDPATGLASENHPSADRVVRDFVDDDKAAGASVVGVSVVGDRRRGLDGDFGDFVQPQLIGRKTS